MRTSCLINNFNYGHFVEEAVESVLAQSQKLSEIIVVDDGSTDDSVDRLRRRYGGDARVTILAQPNGGQLSAFEAGVRRTTGDVVFFLDADDIWEQDYVSKVMNVYRSSAAPDCVFTAVRHFGNCDEIRPGLTHDCDYGYSVAAVLESRPPWIGSPTSALSMRQWVLASVFPLPLHKDWCTRADDCLVFGASVVGARKFYMAEPLVRYRVHGTNCFQGRAYDRHSDYRHRLAINRLIKLLADRMGWNQAALRDMAYREFMTHTNPEWKDLRFYSRICLRSDAPLYKRCCWLIEMTAYWTGLRKR